MANRSSFWRMVVDCDMRREASASAPKIEEPNPNRGSAPRTTGTERYDLSMIGSTTLDFPTAPFSSPGDGQTLSP